MAQKCQPTIATMMRVALESLETLEAIDGPGSVVTMLITTMMALAKLLLVGINLLSFALVQFNQKGIVLIKIFR